MKKAIFTIEIQNGVEMVLIGHDVNGKEVWVSVDYHDRLKNKSCSKYKKVAMKTKLVNTARISISDFTFDSKTNTISFFSTKTNKCWSKMFSLFDPLRADKLKQRKSWTQKDLITLKKLCKNGNN